MAARVMDLADPSQIFLTADAYALIVNLIRGAGTKFRKYGQAKIKHDLRIDVYQYIDASREGVDISPRADLDLADDPLKSGADQVTPVEPTPEGAEDSGSKPLNGGRWTPRYPSTSSGSCELAWYVFPKVSS